MKIGKISESVLKCSILKTIKMQRNEILCGAGIGEDCAIFAPSEQNRVCTAMQTAIITSTNELETLIHKCTNNIASSGAEPIAIMLSIVMPSNVAEQKLNHMMEAANNLCTSLNMQIIGGHTTVSDAVQKTVVTVTGYGQGTDAQVRTTKGARPGQDIVLSKWIGLEGTAMLAKEYKDRLLTRYPAYLVEEAETFDQYISILPEAAVAARSGACVMHDASEGGIYAALWELAESSGIGLSIDLKKLPIRQETVEVCEFCGVNPYTLMSGGCLLMTTEDGLGLVKALETANINAAIIGKITDNKDKIIRNEDEVRFLDRPKTDEIYKDILFE